MRTSTRLGQAVRRRLGALDRMLGIEDAQRTERAWLVPAAVLIGTILGFLVIGQVTAAPLYVSLPNGVIIALVMAGLSVACMSPGTADGPAHDPPADHDDSPVLGSPGGPWLVVAHLGAPSPDEPLPAQLSGYAGDSGDPRQNCGLTTITNTTKTASTPTNMPTPRTLASAAE